MSCYQALIYIDPGRFELDQAHPGLDARPFQRNLAPPWSQSSFPSLDLERLTSPDFLDPGDVLHPRQEAMVLR